MCRCPLQTLRLRLHGYMVQCYMVTWLHTHYPYRYSQVRAMGPAMVAKESPHNYYYTVCKGLSLLAYRPTIPANGAIEMTAPIL